MRHVKDQKSRCGILQFWDHRYSLHEQGSDKCGVHVQQQQQYRRTEPTHDLRPPLSGRVSGLLQLQAHTDSGPAEVEIQLLHVLGFPPMAQRNMGRNIYGPRGLLRGRFFRQVRAHGYNNSRLYTFLSVYLFIQLIVAQKHYLFNLIQQQLSWDGKAAVREASHRIFNSCCVVRGLVYMKKQTNKFTLILFENHKAMI